MMPLVLVSCPGCAGILLQNGVFWGELGPNSPVLSIPLSPNGRFYFTFLPLRHDVLPLSIALELKNGMLRCTPEHTEWLCWPGNVIELRLLPQKTLFLQQLRTPHGILSRKNADFAATVYEDTAVHLAIERLGDDALVFHHTLRQKPEEPYLEFRFLHEQLTLTLFDYADGYTVCAAQQQDGTFSLLFEEVCEYRFDGADLELIIGVQDSSAHQKKLTFAGGPPKAAYGYFTVRPYVPQTPEETARALVNALHLGLLEEAKGYLSRGLCAQYSPEDILAFFEEHLLLRDLPFAPNPSELCLGAVCRKKNSARIFFFDTVAESSIQGPYKIDNIREP